MTRGDGSIVLLGMKQGTGTRGRFYCACAVGIKIRDDSF